MSTVLTITIGDADRERVMHGMCTHFGYVFPVPEDDADELAFVQAQIINWVRDTVQAKEALDRRLAAELLEQNPIALDIT